MSPVRRWFAWVLPTVAVVFAATRLWLPLYSIGPGPAREVAPLVHVDGRPVYASQGRWVLTAVRIERLTAVGAIASWLDPAREVVDGSQIYPAGTTEAEQRERSVSEMDQSKLDATYVVLSDLTDYPAEHGDGVLIEDVVDGCAAEGELYPGDLVLAIGDASVSTVGQARRAIDAVPSGSSVMFDVSAAGERHEIELVREPCGDSKDPLVGVSMIANFPFGVRMESGDIGGSSAGLMWALTLYDLLTAGDLTDGRTIAGTGVLYRDGTVAPIGGIREKIVAASRAGADVFLIPRDNVAEAGATPDGMRLVAIDTFDDAVAVLGGSGS